MQEKHKLAAVKAAAARTWKERLPLLGGCGAIISALALLLADRYLAKTPYLQSTIAYILTFFFVGVLACGVCYAAEAFSSLRRQSLLLEDDHHSSSSSPGTRRRKKGVKGVSPKDEGRRRIFRKVPKKPPQVGKR
eukprot:m.164818 g.164818  ORF g.164818 m.164818 type:complete len:135 (+) comp15247_c2_seq9:1059-1463(+)